MVLLHLGQMKAQAARLSGLLLADYPPVERCCALVSSSSSSLSD